MSEQESRFRGAVYLSMARSINILLSFIAVPIYFKYLGVEGYGVVILAVSFIGVLGLLDLGVPYSSGLRLLQAAHAKDEGRVQRVFGTSFVLLAVLMSLATGVFVVAGLAFVSRNPGTPLAEYPWSFLLVGAGMVLTSLSAPLNAVMTAFERYKLAAQTQAVHNVVLNLFPMALVIATGSPYGHWAGTAVSSLLMLVLLWFVVGTQLPGTVSALKWAAENARDLVKLGLKNMSLKIPGVITSSVNNLAIAAIKPTADLTYFHTANRVPEALYTLYRTTLDTTYPAMTKANQDSPGTFLEFVRRHSQMNLNGAVAMILVPSGFAAPLLSIYLREDYVPVMATVMQIMAWYLLLEMYYGVLSTAAMAKGRPEALLAFSTYHAVARLIAAPLALYYGDIVTLAIANVAIAVVQFVPLHFRIYSVADSKESPWPHIWRSGRVVVVGAAFFFAAVYSSGWIVQRSSWWVVLALPLAQAAYFGAMYALKWAPFPESITKRVAKLVKR